MSGKLDGREKMEEKEDGMTNARTHAEEEGMSENGMRWKDVEDLRK